MKRCVTSYLVAFAFMASSATAEDGPGFALSVKRSHLFGSSSGTLRITADAIEYETTAKNDRGHWPYAEIKQLQIRSPRRMAVLTYEDQGRLKLGADRTFEFEVRDGGISNELVAFLLAHTDRPIPTAVLPLLPPAPLFRVSVKHEPHGRGSDGTYRDAEGNRSSTFGCHTRVALAAIVARAIRTVAPPPVHAIGSELTHADPAVQWRRDAAALYDVLERKVIPVFFDRDQAGLPRRWILRMKRSIMTLAWRFSVD